MYQIWTHRAVMGFEHKWPYVICANLCSSRHFLCSFCFVLIESNVFCEKWKQEHVLSGLSLAALNEQREKEKQLRQAGLTKTPLSTYRILLRESKSTSTFIVSVWSSPGFPFCLRGVGRYSHYYTDHVVFVSREADIRGAGRVINPTFISSGNSLYCRLFELTLRPSMTIDSPRA